MSLQNVQAELAEIILANDLKTDLVQQPENLTIYHHHVTKKLLKPLQDSYPLIRRLLGEDFFTITANEYIKNYPSRTSNLHDYGAYFSDFLAEYQPLHDLMYLAEVAQFEWACHQLQFAADAPKFDLTGLTQISDEQLESLHLVIHPASSLMKCYYPILDIIDLCQGEVDDTVNINAGVMNLLIIRRDMELCLVPLTEAEFHFLNEVQDNKSIADALQTALSYDPAFNLEEKLSLWVQDKTIVAYHIE